MYLNAFTKSTLVLIALKCFFVLPTLAQTKPIDFCTIRPIVQKHCTPCHTSGGSAPYSFNTLKDIKANATTIKHVVQIGYMPLWKPDPAYSHFYNENYLSEADKNILLDWLNSGMDEGNCGKGNIAASNTSTKKPDYVLKLGKPFETNGNNEETFATIKIPFEFDSSFNVKSISFAPDHAKLIHHVSIFVLEQRPDMPDLNTGLDRYTYPPASYVYPEDTFFNIYYDMGITKKEQQFFWDALVYKTHWQIGMSPRVFPDGMGFRMPKKGAIVIDNIHYKGSPQKVLDNIKFNIYAQDSSIKRFCYATTIGNGQLSTVVPPLQIQPEKIQTHYSKLTIPYNMSLLDVTPHMHELGSSFVSFAVTPTNDTIHIIRIKKWDTNWQETYRFNPMLKIPAGSNIFIQGTFDNTSANPNNPSHPPRLVGQSMRKHDEMLEMLISFFDYKPGDETKELDFGLPK